ncbi:tellurite-resistance/dicarboxylate transporter (TDT) family protein [Campylobacter blaseri]|uniref:C4-dicarboxylate ABC transporter n=1 Tax=Campylobacter blaseri TaxID=2042961 RepID=A0A2P8R138_9BACT|nr:SLAC1 anion channel family protein [Campylobacter blaseri]PSM52217.1 C4-dicarboxylate ABC transporter [Campylobacter blaseri]PSM53983.1 C4-dicarboxylate ABC transporter [Campylobacter blaseri]QKF85420.1 tellurite-resistance/dicarboxylate transporter (TDT) family protein [Campylobacter blaseri]
MTTINVEHKSITNLENFPIMFFTVIMGFSGLTMSYEKLDNIFHISNVIFEILKYFTTILFFMISGFYLAKFIKYPKAVKEEFSHPIKINFFAAFSISVLLISNLWSKHALIYNTFFYTGMVVQTFLTFYVISFWINNNLSINASNPSWFMPIVGNLVIVSAARESSHYLWYFFSIGMFFWIVLFTIIFYRIIFHDQLAQKFMPTLFITIAPPSIAFGDYEKLSSNFDNFSFVFLSLSIFFTALILFMYKNFIKLEFFLSWWAFTFPVAVACKAFLKAYEITGDTFFIVIGLLAFLALLILICIVTYETLKSLIKGEVSVFG